MPDELKEQVPLIQEMLRAMGVRLVMKEGYEADDILGTIARTAEKVLRYLWYPVTGIFYSSPQTGS